MTEPCSAPPRLFRAQALEHAGIRRYGTVVLARPVSFSFLTGLFALVAAGIVAFFVVVPYQRKIQVGGVLLPQAGLLRVTASQAGVITARKVQEGQRVNAGDALFVLTSERASATQGDADRAISSLLQSRRDSLFAERDKLRQQAAERLEATQRKADDLAQDIGRIDAEIVLQQRRVAIAEESLQRFSDLQRQNFVSAAQVQDKLAASLEQRQKLADLERAKAVSARDRDAASAEVRDLKLQAQRDQGSASRSIAALEQDLAENEARREIVVRAPQAGTVTAINAEAGQAVANMQVLGDLIPQGTTLQAELYVPSRAAGFIKPGMDVLLRYQAYPYQKFGQHHGRVREVSSTALRPDELALPGAAPAAGGFAEPVYRVRVALDEQSVLTYGQAQPLKPGMLLDASVLLDKRKIYEWALEPLYTITGRI